MTTVDITTTLNKTFREHRRYTGDGLPNPPSGAPLPVGDPSSGVHNPAKSDIRGAFLDVQTALQVAVDAAEAAEDEAQAAQAAAEDALSATQTVAEQALVDIDAAEAGSLAAIETAEAGSLAAIETAGTNAIGLLEGLVTDAVSVSNVPIVSTRASLETLEIPAGLGAVRTNGTETMGDGEQALYVRAVSESDAGLSGVRSADRFLPNGTTDPTNGGWWKLRDFVQVGVGSVARTIDAKLKDNVSVADFGANGDGVDQLAAFQKAIDAFPDGVICVIGVPTGDYGGDIGSLAVGSRKPIWLLASNVSFSGSLPPGQLQNLAFEDFGSPGVLGRMTFGSNGTTDSAEPNFRFYRRTTHTGDPGYAGAVGRALEVVNLVSTNVGTFEYAANFQVLQDVNVTTAQDFAAVAATGVRKAAALGTAAALWGANVVAIDDTGRKSSVSGSEYIRGLETNISASGPDDINLRVGHDMIFFERKPSIDGATSMYAGERVTLASCFNASLAPVSLQFGVLVDRIGTTGIGDIKYGFSSNASLAGFIAQGGAPTIGAFVADVSGGAAVMRLGSDISVNGEVVARVDFHGKDNGGNKVRYSQIESVVIDRTSGTWDGGLYVRNAVDGVDIDMFVLVGGNNPFMRIDGILKQIATGDVDSGGSGFRMLRIAN